MAKEKSEKKKLSVKRNQVLIILVVLFYTFYEMGSIHYVYGKYNKIIDNGLVAIAAFGELKINTNDIDSAASKISTLAEMSTFSENMALGTAGITTDASGAAADPAAGTADAAADAAADPAAGTADAAADAAANPAAGVTGTIPSFGTGTIPPFGTGTIPSFGTGFAAPVIDTASVSTLCDNIRDELSECEASIAKYEALGIKSDVYDDFYKTYTEYTRVIAELLKYAEDDTFSGSKISEIYENEFLSKSSDVEFDLEMLLGNSVADQQNEVKKLQKHKTMNDIFMYIIAAAIIFLFIGIDKRRAKMTQELIDSQSKVEKQRDKISTAVFKDVLTQTNNRTSFISRFSKDNEKLEAGSADYFVMFNIDDFSSVNFTHGVQSGDMILSSTAEKLRGVFEADSIYRTGSDEFVAVVRASANQDGFNKVSGMVDKARMSLGGAHKIRNGSLIVSYSVSVVKKQGPCTVDAAAVLGPLTESLKQGRITQPGVVMFNEV